MIIDLVVRYHSFSRLIINNKDSIFILKFWSSLYYFFSIKRKLSNVFYLITNSQNKKQKSIIEAYFWVFVNWEQNYCIKLLCITEIIFNNTHNIKTSYIYFELNSGYHSRVFSKIEPIYTFCLTLPTN